MVNEHYFSILRRLYLLRRIGENDIVLERILGPFAPSGDLMKAKQALDELVKLGLIIKPKSRDRISINPEHYTDVIRLLDPEPDPAIKNIKPLEDAIPKTYHKVPFLTTAGSHRVKGTIDTYSFHRKRSDPDYIVVFLVSDNQKKSTIHLGSIYDLKSLYRKALLGIDKKFGGTIFTKAMMNDLGKEIVGNRQPPKALIDMMIFDGFVIPKDGKHFQRTVKEIPSAKSIESFIESKTDDISNKIVQDNQKIIKRRR